MRIRTSVVFGAVTSSLFFAAACSPSVPTGCVLTSEGTCAGGVGAGGGGPGFGGGGSPSCSVPPDDGPMLKAARPPPAVSGGTMVVMANGTVAIGDSDRDQVHFVDSTYFATHVSLQAGDEPGRVIEGPAGTVFVALRGARQVAQIDSVTRTVTRFDVCTAPRGVAWRADVQQVLVACADGELATIDLSYPNSPTVTMRRVLDDLRDVMVSNGQVLVTTFRTPQVLALQADGSLAPWSEPAADGNVPPNFVAHVAWRTVATATGLVMVHQNETLTSIPAATACVSPYGDNGSGSPTLFPSVSVLTAGHAVGLPKLPNEALPVDVAATADGTSVAVAMLGSRSVHVMGAGAPAAFFPLKLAGEPVAVAFTGPAAHPTLLVFSREPARLLAFDDQHNQTAELPLSDVSVASTGHQLFHQQTVNGIACASCHPEAGDDGHVWSLPVGARRTPTLRGGLSGTEPFHWNGEEARVNQLVADVLVARMGGAPESDERSNALLDWIDAQPVRGAPADLDASAVARGQASFSAFGCNSCHAGAVGTDNRFADVGTGETLQVPRLVELAYRAPFFHDGRLATLADRFTGAGGAGHTATSGLSADQIDDLVAYLRSR